MISAGPVVSDTSIYNDLDEGWTWSEFIDTYEGSAAFQVAQVYAFRGEIDPAFQWLERAYDERDPGLSYIKGDFFLLASLAGDPRYAAFLERLELPSD